MTQRIEIVRSGSDCIPYNVTLLIRHIMGMSASFWGSAGWAEHVYRVQSQTREYYVICVRNFKYHCMLLFFSTFSYARVAQAFMFVVRWIDHRAYVTTNSSHICFHIRAIGSAFSVFQIRQWHLNQRTHSQLVRAWSDMRQVDSQAFLFTQRNIQLDNEGRTLSWAQTWTGPDLKRKSR